MKKSLVVFLILVVVLLSLLTIFFFMNRNENALEEDFEPNNEIVQEGERFVEIEDEIFEELDEVLGEEASLPSEEFIQCLADSGMVVYASQTCPACTSLANVFGGYARVENLFVLCGDQSERCMEEMQTNYVPEIQYNGEVFDDGRTLESFANLTDCAL